jgi:hypothetical protein
MTTLDAFALGFVAGAAFGVLGLTWARYCREVEARTRGPLEIDPETLRRGFSTDKDLEALGDMEQEALRRNAFGRERGPDA